jgi:hypothetical protein
VRDPANLPMVGTGGPKRMPRVRLRQDRCLGVVGEMEYYAVVGSSHNPSGSAHYAHPFIADLSD